MKTTEARVLTRDGTGNDRDTLSVAPARGNTDAERHSAALVVCGLLGRDDAKTVLTMLGLA